MECLVIKKQFLIFALQCLNALQKGTFMVITELAIVVITHYPGLKKRICEFMGISENTLRRYYQDNEAYGKLTRPDVVEFISKESGLTKQQIILPASR